MSLELNKIYNEDCLETMKWMPDEFIDLTVTSPPYDDMDEDFNPIPKNGLRNYNGYSWDFKAIARELFRTTKTGGTVVWVVNDPTIDGSESLASSLQKIFFRRVGFSVYDTMIYEKNGPAYPSKDRYYQVFEYAFVLSKGTPKAINLIADRKNIWFGQKWSKVRTRRNKAGELSETRWTGELGNEFGVRFNIWQINNGSGYSTDDEIAYQHPATFPEQLARDHIYSWSNEGNLVYDPFMGSGTVAKMAHLMKRNWIGSEISQEYVDLAYKRLDPYLRQTTLF